MGETAMMEGAKAFLDGRLRAGNPYDPSGEEWMCWRDGYEQARAAVGRADAGRGVHRLPVAHGAAPLVRLVYVSVLSPGMTPEDIDALVAHSRRANEGRGITGLMALDEGRVCQILEGPGPEVARLFDRIRADERHRDVIDLATATIERRHFGEWGMARRRMVDVVALAFTL